MNTFCSEIEESACVEDIPDLLRLYYDRAITCEQNEFITEVLTKIVKENPNFDADNKVILAGMSVMGISAFCFANQPPDLSRLGVGECKSN